MARRRADEEPGLIDRVRWRNVGRLVLLVAVLVVALAPRGCGRRQAVLPPEVRVQPPAAPAPLPSPATSKKAERRRQKAGPVTRHHHKRRRHHRRRHVPKPLRPAIPRPATPPLQPRYAAPPAPEFF